MDYDHMSYKFLGASGLRVSALSIGNMNSKIYLGQEVEDIHFQLFDKSIRSGINFIDSAQVYGQSEQELGRLISRNEWDRDELIISTKVNPSSLFDPEKVWSRQGISRKSTVRSIDKSLDNMNLDYIDIYFYHGEDQNTSILEQCRSMNKLIDDEKILYWATSNYTPRAIAEIFRICERYGLEPPIADQSEYNMLQRQTIEAEFVPLYNAYQYGVVTWSPLAMGILTGKYNDGNIPDGTRFSQMYQNFFLAMRFNQAFQNKEKTCQTLTQLGQIAEELGITQAQLALAWVINNKDVSTCLTGVSNEAQLQQNIQAVEASNKLTPEILQRIEGVLGNRPEQAMNYKTWKNFPPRRQQIS